MPVVLWPTDVAIAFRWFTSCLCTSGVVGRPDVERRRNSDELRSREPWFVPKLYSAP